MAQEDEVIEPTRAEPLSSRPWSRSGVVWASAIVAFAQTLAYYAYLRNDPGNYNGAGAFGDQLSYIQLGEQILHGQWQGGAHYMPGEPALLALSEAVFHDPMLGIAVIQGVLFAALVVGIAWFTARAFGPASAPWAAACVGLNPVIGYYASQGLTEFLTAALACGMGAALFAWGQSGRWRWLIVGGAVAAGIAYVRSEYLGLAVLAALIVLVVGLKRWSLVGALGRAATFLAVVALVVLPWLARYALATGEPALYNDSPVSNLVLMGTWFRVFDTSTFAQLQQIGNDKSLTYDQAVEEASLVGPRPDLSVRYMEDLRGPYDRPLGETLSLALGNIELNPRQYLVNHLVLAPILIWIGHTPIRQSSMGSLPSGARWLLWGTQLLFLVLAVWGAISSARHGAGYLVLCLTFFAVALFLTALHVVIAVDDRFTVPALPLAQMYAGTLLASLVARRWRSTEGVQRQAVYADHS